MTSTDDLGRNLAEAERWVRAAVEHGAELVALPEGFAYLRREGLPVPCAQSLDGEIIAAVRRLARELRVWILAGSFPESGPDPGRCHNTSVMISPGGDIEAVYRKIHLFDVDLRGRGGSRFVESDAVAPGREVVVAKTPFGGVGMSVCYDLRFPELYRAHAERGARFLAVPSAFARETGRDHWQVLLQARAIENQAFVLAPAQWGRHSPERTSYGRSLIVDPWGTILAQAPDRPCAIVADCDLEAQGQIRSALPVLRHRRL